MFERVDGERDPRGLGEDDERSHDDESNGDDTFSYPVAGAEPVPQEMHNGIPIAGWYVGEPIPDLGVLPKERWHDALRPLRHATRRRSVSSVRAVADVDRALMLVSDLRLEDDEARARAEDAAPPPMPAGDPPAQGDRRQINFRLGPSEHERLLQAAKLFAMRPTTLARVLTMRGVERALYEERRDR